MNLEVEVKFAVQCSTELENRLSAMGVVLGAPQLEVDTYFAHPVRNFAETDEAFRVRCVGDRSWITYKGPKLDSTTKTRREIELLLADHDVEGQLSELFQALSFREVATVRKRRRRGQLIRDGHQVTVVLDVVEELGEFAELEIVTPESGYKTARETLQLLATSLGLATGERRSYLELLLEKHAE